MKTKSLYIWIFQIFAVIFLLIGISSELLLNNEYELFLFENTCLYFVYQIGYLLFLITEFVMFIVLTIKKKKLLFLIGNIILLPLLLIQGFAADFAVYAEATTKLYSYENFDADIVISSRSLLLSGNSTIYEKNDSILIHKIARADGDDGYAPLKDESKFKVTVDDKKITYIYYFDGYSLSDESMEVIVLKYDDGHFKQIA